MRPQSKSDERENFMRQKHWSRLGLVLFLLSLPAGVASSVLGHPPFADSGLPTVAGWLLIAVFVAPGLGLMLYGAMCPSCRQLVRSRSWIAGKCPYCGARVEGRD